MWFGILFALNALLNLGLSLVLAWVLPSEVYGVFVIYFAAALLIGNLAYEWIRVSAVRFYVPTVGAGDLRLRATLDVAMACSTGLAVAFASLIAACGGLPRADLAALGGLIALTAANA